MNIRLITIGLLVVACCAYAQEAALNRDTIMQMSKVGLPDDVIVGKIRGEARPPKMSAEDLIALKSAGVSDSVLRALVSPVPVAEPPGMKLTAVRDPNDPMSPHDPGIYMVKTAEDGSRKLVLMEPAAAGNEKTSNMWAYVFSYGIAKMSIKAQIPGARAELRTPETNPVFSRRGWAWAAPTWVTTTEEPSSSPRRKFAPTRIWSRRMWF